MCIHIFKADRPCPSPNILYVAPQTISQKFSGYYVQKFFLLLFLVFLFCSNKTYHGKKGNLLVNLPLPEEW